MGTRSRQLVGFPTGREGCKESAVCQALAPGARGTCGCGGLRRFTLIQAGGLAWGRPVGFPLGSAYMARMDTLGATG